MIYCCLDNIMLYLICFIKEKTVKYGNRVVEKVSSKDKLDKLEKE